MTNQPRFRGRFDRIHPSFTGIDQERNQAMTKAESNGVYEINGHRFRIRAGGKIPNGATFTADGEAAIEASADEPKWYQQIVAEAAEKGEAAVPREEKESEKAYRERIAALGESGPSENTAGNGPEGTS